jgi:hypothetical protein
MRHRTLLIGILLSALLLGGWGGVIAAAFCAHDAGARSMMAEEHDCCRAQLEKAQPHCGANAPPSSSSSHEEMTMDEMEAMPVASAAAAQPLTAAVVVALDQLGAACQHCVSRRELPATFLSAQAAEQKRRDANHATPPQLKMLSAPVAYLTSTLAARQNAPPGQPARRHLLLGVLVI